MASLLTDTFDPDLPDIAGWEDQPAEVRGRAIRAQATGDGITLEALFFVLPNGKAGGFVCAVPDGLDPVEIDALVVLRRRATEGTWSPAALARITPLETYARGLAVDAALAWEHTQ